MSRTTWPLRRDRPRIQVVLTTAAGGAPLIRNLLADTGAGTARPDFELLLTENDCVLCGGKPGSPILLGGAYSGSFPVYRLRVQIPTLGFDHHIRVFGVHAAPAGFAGIACFPFLNRFTYGNLGDPGQFALETLSATILETVFAPIPYARVMRFARSAWMRKAWKMT